MSAIRLYLMYVSLAALAALLPALVWAWLRAHRMRSGLRIWAHFRRQTLPAQLLLAAIVVRFVVIGSTKTNEERGGWSEERGGEREIREEIADSSGEIRKQIADSSEGRVVGSRDPRDRNLPNLNNSKPLPSSLSPLPSSLSPLPSSLPHPSFRLVGVATNETFDFEAPADAVVATNWVLRGAAEDWVRVGLEGLEGWQFPMGTNLISRFTVLSGGAFRPRLGDASVSFSPFEASLGIVPAANWHLFGGTGRASRFWWRMSDAGELALTWENVLLGRLIENPVSFQAVLRPNGDFDFRYDLSRVASPDALTNALVRVTEGATSVTGPVPTAELTSLSFRSAESIRVSECLDALAERLGGLDPFGIPSGSTNSVLEHVFYTGTTNAPFALPCASASIAVLSVTVTGRGSGALLVGDLAVPLVGGATNTLRVAVAKDERTRLFLDADATLSVALSSPDFAFGEPPDPAARRAVGWIVFPQTAAAAPCIHDFSTRETRVALDAVDDGLAAVWHETDDVEVWNSPPRSAVLKGYFDPTGESPVTYTVSHPLYLFGATEFTQSVRFCPRLRADEIAAFSDPPEPPSVAQPAALAALPDDDGPAAQSFSNAVAEAACESGNVLYLRRANAKTLALDVPAGVAACCCGCPDHTRSNHVDLVYSSECLRVDGGSFSTAFRPCTVTVSGASPSRTPNDARVAFATNGVLSRIVAFTVLGVGFETVGGDRPRLDRYNGLSASFGYPFTVNTNLDRAVSLDVRTDVGLTNGVVRLALENATGDMRVVLPEWYDDGGALHPAETLLATGGRTERHFGIGEWRSLLRRHRRTDGTTVKLLSSEPCRADLAVEFASSDGVAVHDWSRQRLTSVPPLLVPDFNRDGCVDGTDGIESALRKFHFWVNRDVWKNDNAFDEGYWDIIRGIVVDTNGDDGKVNGRNDLVNLCPFKVDLHTVKRYWQSTNVVCEFVTGDPGNVRFVEAKTEWRSVGGMVKEDQQTVPDGDLHSAALLITGFGRNGREAGYELSEEMAELNRQGRGILAVEFADAGRRTLRLRIRERSDSEPLIEFTVTAAVEDVHDMYRWINLEGECGESVDSRYDSRTQTAWPDSEHADANVVFVHGYNVHPSEAWDWSQAVFKRLWWSGMDAGFTAVLWRGNQTQVWIPGWNVYATKNYHQNVHNAFRTAAGLSRAAAALPGARKYFIAHSLGNMLVSAARQFHGLEYDGYLMLNAAVPLEAYDADAAVTDESKFCMTPEEWRPYPDQVKASHWHELFDESDARHRLTWKGIFRDVDKTVNFYSSRDEVVANGDGNEMPKFSRQYAWYNQERLKGTRWVDLAPEAGWVFGVNYQKEVFDGWDADNRPWYHYRNYNASEAAAISPDDLKIRPFFQNFSETAIYGTGGGLFVQDNDHFRWRVLSHGIPAESFAAGANPVPKWESDKLNVNMATKCGREVGDKVNIEWIHSYFIQRSLYDTHRLYEQLVNCIKTGSPEGRSE